MKRGVLALLIAAALPAMAQQLADGEIRKVDKKAANRSPSSTGRFQAIDMPAMTMVFQAKEPAMLDRVKAGDKVKFQARNGGGRQVTVTRIEPVK